MQMVSFLLNHEAVRHIFRSDRLKKLSIAHLNLIYLKEKEKLSSINVLCDVFPSDGPQLSGSEEVTVEEEAELLLECDIRANPPVFSVSWTLNGSKVELEAGGFTESNDGFKTKLSASNVEKTLHEGTYQCSTNSTLYGAHNKIFLVKLTGQFTQSPFHTSLCQLVLQPVVILACDIRMICHRPWSST